MAKATVSMTEVAKLVLTQVQKKTFTLTLSENEAIAITHLAASVGGIPENTYRQYSQTVAKALYEAGISCPNIDENWFQGELQARKVVKNG